MHKELFERMNKQFQMAEAFHRESELAFYYLALPGFSELHRYQYLDESITHCNVIKYAIDNFGLTLEPNGQEDARVLLPITDNIDRLAMDEKSKIEAIEKLWKWYYEWEEESLQEYAEISAELRNDNHIAAAIFVEKIVEDVNEELSMLTSIWLELKGMNFDMPTMTSMQGEIKKEYQKKIKNIF